MERSGPRRTGRNDPQEKDPGGRKGLRPERGRPPERSRLRSRAPLRSRRPSERGAPQERCAPPGAGFASGEGAAAAGTPGAAEVGQLPASGVEAIGGVPRLAPEDRPGTIGGGAMGAEGRLASVDDGGGFDETRIGRSAGRAGVRGRLTLAAGGPHRRL